MTAAHHYWPGILAGHPEMRDRLLETYAGPGRWYHDSRHLAEVCDRIQLLARAQKADGHPLPVGEEVLIVAAWFHDAVYDSAGSNEERSAVLAERVLSTTQLPPATIAEVARLVRLTKTHDPDEQDLAGAVLCDADLGILAAPEDRYREYTRDVRREYAHVAEEQFRRGRAELLRTLVDRPYLFHTRYARAQWEEQARSNVQQELVQLQRPAG